MLHNLLNFHRSQEVDGRSSVGETSGPSMRHSDNSQRYSGVRTRIQRSLENERSGYNANLLGGILSSVFSLRPSYMNFASVLRNCFNPSGPQSDPLSTIHQGIASALKDAFGGFNVGNQQHSTTPEPATNGSHHETESHFPDGDRYGEQLLKYQSDMEKFKNGEGPEPAVPRCIPAHLHPFVKNMEPSLESFGPELQAMVNADAEIQKNANKADLIGQAPKPKPGHFRHDGHGHEDNQALPDNQNTDPALDHNNDDLYEVSNDGSSSHRPALETPQTPAPRRHQATVSDDGSSGVPPAPTGPSNRH